MTEDSITLIGRYRSPFTRRVAVSMRLLDIRYELRPRTAWQHFDEILELNPIGRVPLAILETGEVLFESAVILDYLDGRVGPQRALLPSYGRKRREAQLLAALAFGAVDKGRELLYETSLRPQETRHEPFVKRWTHQLSSVMAALEARAGLPYACGGCLTQADIAIGVMVDFILQYHPQLLAPGTYPRLDELAAGYGALSAFQETRPESD